VLLIRREIPNDELVPVEERDTKTRLRRLCRGDRRGSGRDQQRPPEHEPSVPLHTTS
jgi:hypothetical protein